MEKGVNLRSNALFIDLIGDLHRINSHIAAAAYPLTQAAGLLNTTRRRTSARSERSA
ncbi:hypothetical protein [Ensifer canadensis]